MNLTEEMFQPHLKKKTNTATGDYVLQIIMSRKNVMDIQNIISCRGRNIFVIVESCRPHCWSCGAAVHLSKAYSGKRQAPKPATPVSSAYALKLSGVEKKLAIPPP